MIKAKTLFFILLATTTLSITCSAQQYSADDILAFTRVANVVASPSGAQIAFITWNRNNTNKLNWRYALDIKDENGNIKEITHADYITSIDWSPDGKSIAYIAVNKNQQILAVYEIAHQKILPIVTLSQSITALKWSPSGKEIAFVADEKNQKMPENLLINAPQKSTNSRLYLIKDLNSHPLSIEALTPLDMSISEAVFGGGFDWSSNGRDIAFTYQPGPTNMDGFKSKVAILNLSTLTYRTLSFCSVHTCAQPMYSPNGHWLAFSTNILSNGKARALLEDIDTQKQVCLVNSENQTYCLQNTPNENSYLLGWKANSHGVYVADMYKAKGTELYELSTDGSTPAKLISTQKAFIEPLTLSINRTNTIFGFGMESAHKAPEAFTASTDSFQLNQITNMNQKFNKRLGNLHVLHWSSTDGTAIEGILITPIHYDSHQKYPLYVDVHGGPSGAQEANRYLGGCDEYSEDFPITSCPGNILSLGFVILQVNYRGSNSYGLDFRVKNFADFGGGDYHDIMSGIDYLIEKGLVDRNKIVIAGWSYGGYMATWSISKSSRFYKAIDGEGPTNFISYTGTSDDTNFFLRYMGSYFWEGSHQLYWDRSPIAHVQNIQTPLLIFQGGEDARVPPSQSQELYTALTLLKRPVKMLISPNQSHEPTDPDTIRQEINAIDAWLQDEKFGTPVK